MFFLREFSLLHSYGNNIDSNNSNNTTTSCSPITEMSAWVYTTPLGTVSVRTDSVVSACMVFAEETDVCSFTRNRIWRQVLLESHQKHCKQINRHIKISKTHPEGSDAKTNRDWQLIDQYQYECMRLRERLEFNHVLKQLGYIFIFIKTQIVFIHTHIALLWCLNTVCVYPSQAAVTLLVNIIWARFSLYLYEDEQSGFLNVLLAV